MQRKEKDRSMADFSLQVSKSAPLLIAVYKN